MLCELQWPTMQARRMVSSYSTIFYKDLQCFIALEVPTYITPTTTASHLARFQFNITTAKTNFYHTVLSQKLCVIGTLHLFL